MIELDPEQMNRAAVSGLMEFSHVEILFHSSQVPDSAVVKSARHRRNNPAWPKVGILARRGKVRPNRMAATICELDSVDGSKLTVRTGRL